MRRLDAVVLWVALVVVFVAGTATAAQPAAEAPPLLSTIPTPPTGAVSQPTQMSGLPLQVGDLPPGTVAVRVIRQSFSNNLANRQVEIQSVASGRTLTSTTNAAGRAIFEGLAVGELVSVSAVVDGERLESQRFELPDRGGVRMVLVAGVGAGAEQVPEPVTGPAAPLYLLPLAVFIAFGAGIWWSRTRRAVPSV